MSSPILDIENLGLAFGAAQILDDVSFSVAEGEFLSIIGPNGAGKTSLLTCLNRIHRPTSGTIQLLGKQQRDYSQRRLAREISYVPQSDGRYVPFTVREYVLMARYPYLSPFSSISEDDHEATEAALALTDIAEFGDRQLSTLSGGERQKVHIAAAVAQGARIMLLDEPTTFLDYRHQLEITTLLQQLNQEQGITVIAVTHDVSVAVLASSNVLALKQGRVAFWGTPDKLVADDTLESIYDTPFDVLALEGRTLVLPKGSTT